MNIVIVGGIPEPIGGVTTFVSRILCSDERIKVLVDFYYSKRKVLPECYKEKFINNKLKIINLLYVFFLALNKNNFIHLNFSSTRSLLLLSILPGFNKNLVLMLHHGELNSGIPHLILKYILSKFNKVIAINEKQERFYQKFISPNNIIKMSSYYPPKSISKNTLEQFNQKYKNIFLENKQIALCSGYPRAIYNLTWCIKYFFKNTDKILIVCSYGEGEEFDNISKLIAQQNNIFHFHDLHENEFNYLLYKSNFYIRPTTTDSFGIAVADAINFETVTLATDVCRRYQGSYLFSISSYKNFEKTLNLFFHNKDKLNKEYNSTKHFNYEQLIAKEDNK